MSFFQHERDEEILRKLDLLLDFAKKEKLTMADLTQALADVAKGTADVLSAAQAEIANTTTIIGILKNVPAGTPITQEQIDQLETASQSLETVAGNLGSASTAMQDAINAATPPSAAPSTPPPAA